MQLPPWICVLLATVFLWGAGRAQLTVFIEEARAMESNPTMELVVNEARTFSLVPGFTYQINCRSLVGFGGLANVWQDGEGNGITIMTPAPELDFDQPAVYSTQRDPADANVWSLVLQSFTESNTGTYVCQTEEGGTNATLVIGAANPTIIPNTPRLELTQGFQEIRPTLRALASSDPLPDRVMWLLDGEELQSGDMFIVSNTNSLGELLFPQGITIDHAGDYVFRMESGAGNLSLTLTVVVNIQPSVSIDPSTEQTIDAGDRITITCTDGRGSPTPTFTWSHNDEEVQAGERVTIATSGSMSSLSIDPVQREDAGNYACLAVNTAGQSRISVDVVVQFRPVLESLAPAEVVAAVGEASVSLQAELIAAVPPVSNYTWRRLSAQGNVILTASEKYSFSEDNLTLSIADVESADHGVYTLEATNQRGAESTDFVLVVIAPINETQIYAAYGASIILQVDISAPQSSTTTFSIEAQFGTESNPLLLDGGRYSGMVEGDTATLGVASLVLSDIGQYAVIISGGVDSAEVVFELEVLFLPAPPTNLIATSLSDCVAMVTWQPVGPPAANTAAADSTIIERQSGDATTVWEAVAEIAVGTSETTVDLPGIAPGTLYRFRARSRSALVGIGEASQPSDNVTGYSANNFPSVESLVGSAAGFDRVGLSWELPESECLVFASFDVKCYPLDAAASGTTGEVTAGRGSTSVEVPGLTPDLRYECDVTSKFEDREGNAFDFPTESELVRTFTYPEPPPFSPDSLPVEEPGKPPTETTITVRFSLPETQDSVSYYQVIVLRLESKDPPTDHPGTLYPPGFLFADTDDDGDSPVPYIAAEVNKTDFNTLFTIGGGQVEGSLFANEELNPGTYYTCFLRAFVGSELESTRRKRQASGRQNIVFSSSDFLPGLQTEMVDVSTGGSSPNTRTIGIAVAVIVVVVLVIAAIIIIIGVVTLHRMKKSGSLRIEEVSIGSPSFLDDNSTKGGSPEIPEMDTPDLAKRQSGVMELKPTNEKLNDLIPSGPIPVQDFDSHIDVFDAKRQLLFQSEFDWIQAHAPWHPAEGSNNPLNEDKNRYSNITAYDHTRVRLTPIEGIQASDYINANYISGYKQEKEYIATQGPLDQTVCDFWRMVWEQNTATIVMLTGLVELGKNKCHQYWPDNSTTVYGSLQVTLEHSVVLPDYTIRNLRVLSLMTGDSRTVLQFHFTKWPDYGTPKLAAPLLNFLRAVHASNPDNAGPINIHCSAGVGRSGTVICIDYCLKQARAENIVDIQGCVSRMREQRNYMVQTEQQYTFIHYAVMEAIAYGNTSFPLADFPSSYQQLQEKSGQTGSTLLEEEFARLGTLRTMVKKSSFVQKVKQKQANGRRSIHYPSVQYENSGTNPEYNAHYIDTYFQPKLFIAADIPTPESAARFWQMVWDQGCSYIVMLTPLDAEFYCYWPSSQGQEQHGNVVVEVTEESAEHLYTTRTITLTNAKDGISHRVQQYQFIGWTSNYFPPVPTFVSFVCEVLKGVETLEKNQRLLVHDIESLGPSGIFCSLCYCIERLRVERMVDVFQAVQKIQLQRPGMVESMQQYAFVYDCVYEFIRTHSNS